MFCGLDFGTSNTTIGVNMHDTYQLIPLEKGELSMRSAIFCDNEINQLVFGQEGINSYLEGVPGRLMMALKTVLGSPLMEDNTLIFNEFIPYTKILSYFINHIKSLAEAVTKTELTQVVLGRPVHFYDHDIEKDRHAENTLAAIAREIGFKDITFQYEPIAAALTYEMTIQHEQLALIIDMGGGTSDFTVIRLHPNCQLAERAQDVLANCGIHIAGTDFDQRLSLQAVMPLLGMGSLMRGSSSDIEIPSMFFHDLTTWHTLTHLYSATMLAQIKSIHAMSYAKDRIARLLKVLRLKAGHHILNAVETSKQYLSEKSEVNLDLDFIEAELHVLIQRNLLNTVIDDQVERIIHTINNTIRVAGVQHADINAIFYTGGSTKIPMIRSKINQLFPQAEVVQGDALGSVGLGLAIDAKRKYQPTTIKC